MAFRTMAMLGSAQNHGRSMLSSLAGHRAFATSTITKMRPFAPTADLAHGAPHTKPRGGIRAEFAPIYVTLGMVLFAFTIGAHTAKQQLMHSPTVQVSKKKRESVPEVENPDDVVSSADKFINKSFFRKVAHIQEVDPQSIRGVDAPFTRPRNAETLKSVGVDPSRH